MIFYWVRSAVDKRKLKIQFVSLIVMNDFRASPQFYDFLKTDMKIYGRTVTDEKKNIFFFTYEAI